jgi:hypothetical protein
LAYIRGTSSWLRIAQRAKTDLAARWNRRRVWGAQVPVPAAQEADAGLTALSGPGVTVRLDDAPRRADGARSAGATVDDLVVHQQDVRAVVNALWAGGAEAVMYHIKVETDVSVPAYDGSAGRRSARASG